MSEYRTESMAVANKIIKDYSLEGHPEGGFFSEVYTSETVIDSGNKRPAAGSIFFLLPPGAISHFHQIDCEEIWYYHSGCGIKLRLISSDGEMQIKKLGMNPADDEMPMVVIPKGAIFAAENLDADGYTFVSCVTAPKFRYEGFRLVPYDELKAYGVEPRLCI